MRSLLRFFLQYFLLLLVITSVEAASKIGIRTYYLDPVSKQQFLAWEKTHALIIAVDAYKTTEPRVTAVSSAKAMKDFLQASQGFSEENIIALYNEQARQTVIADAIQRILKAGPQDQIILYFAGRGETVKDEHRKEFGFFIPYNGDISTPERTAATCISLDVLKKSLDSSKVKHVFTILDFSVGGLPVLQRFATLPPPRKGVGRIIDLKARPMIAASDRFEKFVEDVGEGVSLFTSAVISAMTAEKSDLDDDGLINATEIATSIGDRVTIETDRRQHPQFGYMNEDRGDFFLIKQDTKTTSRLFLTSKPSDVTVFIDGAVVQNSVEGIAVPMGKTGLHTIQLQREDYHPVKGVFFVNGREEIRVDAELEKVIVQELLVKISEPDAKVYLDGKFVGMPDQSLLLEKLPFGVHKVRVELAGFFSDSATVNIEKPIRYTHEFKLRSRNGFLTVLSSDAVNIEVDGKFLGIKEVRGKEFVPGRYTLKLSGIGYSTDEELITIGDGEMVQLARPMSRASLGGALWRSAVYPGWGQWYSGRNGLLHAGVFTILLVAEGGLNFLYFTAESDYHKNYDLYKKATRGTEVQKYRSLSETNYNDMGNYNTYRLGVAGAIGVWYLYNLYDVITHNPADLIKEEEAKQKKEKATPKVSMEYGLNGPVLKVSFPF